MIEYFFSHYFHYGFYFLLGWFSLLLYRTGLFSEIGTTLRENKLFFILLTGVFIIIPLQNSPFNPLVHFDEHNYILSAQNIIENGAHSICAVDIDGQCQKFNIAPHGLGVGSIYALLYDYRFDIFYKKVAILNLFLYLLNAVFMFIISNRLYSNKTVSMASSILILLMPFNIIYATTAMPATISNTLFLISIYCFLQLTKFRKNENISTSILNNVFGLSLFCALAILSTIRLEYCALLQAFLLTILCSDEFLFRWDSSEQNKILDLSKKKFLQTFQYTAILLIVATIYCYADFYNNMKAHSVEIGKFSPYYLHWGYVIHYFKNIGFWLLSIIFITYLIRLIIKVIKEGKFKEELFRVILFSVFFSFLTLYSFYNFQDCYRFIIPITSIYVLFSLGGLFFVLFALIKDEQRALNVMLLCVIGIGILFVSDGIKWKEQIIIKETNNRKFLNLIQEDNLDKLTEQYDGEVFYFFRAPYLGQVTRIHNYLDDLSLSVENLKAGANLFYLESPFERINSSPFNNPEEFNVYKEGELYGYGIYRIELRI